MLITAISDSYKYHKKESQHFQRRWKSVSKWSMKKYFPTLAKNVDDSQCFTTALIVQNMPILLKGIGVPEYFAENIGKLINRQHFKTSINVTFMDSLKRR